MIRGAPLDRKGDDLTRFFVRFVLELLFELDDLLRLLVADLAFELRNELFRRLLCRHAGDLLEGLKLFLLDLVDGFVLFGGFLQLLLESLVLLLHRFGLAVEGFFLGLHAAFLTGQLGAAFFQFEFKFVLGLQDLFLRFEQRFFFLGVRRLDAVFENPLCLFLRGSDFGFRDLSAICNAARKTCGSTYNSDDNGNDVFHPAPPLTVKLRNLHVSLRSRGMSRRSLLYPIRPGRGGSMRSQRRFRPYSHKAENILPYILTPRPRKVKIFFRYSSLAIHLSLWHNRIIKGIRPDLVGGPVPKGVRSCPSPFLKTRRS